MTLEKKNLYIFSRINKFQQGGKTSSQQDAVMQFVQALAKVLQTDPNLVIQAAQANPEALKSAVQVYQLTLDIQLAAQTFSLALQLKTQAAKHGAKLNYLRSLKNKCAEDEELYYFKKGGSVGCGCKKKEQGGELKESAINKFKAIKKNLDGDKLKKLSDKALNDSISKYNKPYPKEYTSDDKIKQEENLEKFEAEKERRKNLPKKEVKKEACGGVAKFKADKCGGKMKKHKDGGSLNGVPFMLKGKDLPTAPKAEDRYKNGRKEITAVHPYDVIKFAFRGTRPIRKVNSGSASISEIIKDTKDGTPTDTMYYEIPNHLPFVKVQPRYSFSFGDLSYKYGNNPEFNILKRRFNTAWNLAK